MNTQRDVVSAASAVAEMSEGSGSRAVRSRRAPRVWLVLLVLLVPLPAGVALYEIRTSYGQAAVFTRVSAGFGYELGTGPSDRIRFPSPGPFDVRLGYDRIPSVIDRLDSFGFEVTRQARLTRSLTRWVEWGLYPIYREKGHVGLRIDDRAGRPLVDERFPLHAYQDFDSIPELVWRTLLYIETRGLLDEGSPRRNPAVEWDRLAFSAANLALREIDSGRPVPGGSTLATQIEKYRHSPGGITRTPGDKLRQMLAASLRAYSQGSDTYEQRRWVVTEYVNSVPLAGQVGHGEVVGLGDGLRTWYGTPFDQANAILRHDPDNAMQRVERARIYRQTLSLLVAQRRPSAYLSTPAGRASLAGLTDVYLKLLERDGVIPRELARDARHSVAPTVLATAPQGARPDGTGLHKGVSSVRSHLLGLTGTRSIYELDRLDLGVRSTLDGAWDSTAASLLSELATGRSLEQEGFRGQGLLSAGDPSRVLYSVLLLERTDVGNVVRIQSDNFPGDLRMADGSRLELGSTAKLRTLVTYLEIVEELHARLSGLDPDRLRGATGASHDPLTRWVARRLVVAPDLGASDLLLAAMQRTYSASPREQFITGGAHLTFSNFDNQFDQRVLTVEEAFRQSVNLPFIRLMRDIVEYEQAELHAVDSGGTGDDAWRQEYLTRFAQREGGQFVRRFHRRYQGHSGHEVFDVLLGERRLSVKQVAWAVRAVAPDAGVATLGELLRTFGPEPTISDARIESVWQQADPTRLTWSDLGYLARVHPLELWVAGRALHRPGATAAELLEDSREVTVDVYGWLFRSSRTRAQNERIRAMLEIEAFQRVHARWRRLGYAFDDLTPSLGTAIGSSGDRPLALAELAGLVLNDGVRLPVVRVDEVRLGEGTPFETQLALRPSGGERAMSSDVAAVVRAALFGVVESGTGRRARGAMTGADGQLLRIGGKTGTGDNRHRVYDDRGRLRRTVVLNRTATFVFIVDDRYFGVVTAHVQGPEAEAYRFTSALPTQLFRVLGKRLGAIPGRPPETTAAPSPLRLASDPVSTHENAGTAGA